MYTHENLQEFGKFCASKVTPAITNQQIDYKKLANEFAESILNRPDHRKGAYDNGVTGEDVVKVLANNFYGSKGHILDHLLAAFKVLDGWNPQVSKDFVTAVYNYEKEKCKNISYFMDTYIKIEKPEPALQNHRVIVADNSDAAVIKNVVHDIKFIPCNGDSELKWSLREFDGVQTALSKYKNKSDSKIEYGKDTNGWPCIRISGSQGPMFSSYVYYRQPWKIKREHLINYDFMIADRFGPLVTNEAKIANRRYDFWTKKGYC